jgi:hypothetical protein
MYYSPTYRLGLYRNFKSLAPGDFYGVVRFFEAHEEALFALDTEAYLDCALGYTNALFETDDYRRHNVMCDHLIQLIMAEGIYSWGGEDLFSQLLHKKAQALYRLESWPEAIHVLRQLRKIEPDNPEVTALLKETLLELMPPVRRRLRAVALLLLFVSAIAMGASGLIVQSFFEVWGPLSAGVSAGLFVMGLLILCVGEGWYYFRCKRWAQQPDAIRTGMA